jgi:hypothetical protein
MRSAIERAEASPVERLKSRIDRPEIALPDVFQLGLSVQAILRISHEFAFPSLAERLPQRGSAAGLRVTAWKGSILADIACPEVEPLRRTILSDGALFNVAVALFDTAIETSLSAPALVDLLRPSALQAKLTDGPDLIGDSAWQPLVALFDGVLSNVCRRFPDLAERRVLAGMLRDMYESELERNDDPFKSKTLPIQFIGRIADTHRRPETEVVVLAMAALFALVDDACDVDEDAIAGSPNFFLRAGSNSGVDSKEMTPSNEIEDILSEQLVRVMTACHDVDHRSAGKVLAFVNHILGLEWTTG